MKISQKALLALVVGSVLSVSAQAAVSMGEGQPYVGAKVGQFMIDEDTDTLDDLTAYGIIGGYNFTPAVGMEVEYVGSSDKTIDIAGVDVDYDLKTYGIYGTYNYTFPNTSIYAKGKLGLAKAEVKASAAGVSASDSDTGLAGGIGLGYNFNPNVAVEGEWSYVAEDVTLLTVGAKYKF